MFLGGPISINLENPGIALAAQTEVALTAFIAAQNKTGPAMALTEAVCRLAVYSSTNGSESPVQMEAWNAAHWALLTALKNVRLVRNAYPSSLDQLRQTEECVRDAVNLFIEAVRA
jgi:molybdenum cofactor biosynthesis enzyme